MQQKTSRTIHQPTQRSTARSMLRSKLCQLQSPKQNAPCFDVEGFNSRRKPHWHATEDVEDNSSAKAMLDRAFDATLEVVSAPEPETERSLL